MNSASNSVASAFQKAFLRGFQIRSDYAKKNCRTHQSDEFFDKGVIPQLRIDIGNMTQKSGGASLGEINA